MTQAARRTAVKSHVRSPINLTDVRGLSKLSIDAVLGVTGLTEAMHANIARVSTLVGKGSDKPTRGITGLVYRSIRGVTKLVGGSIDRVLSSLTPAFAELNTSEEREALLAVVNGVFGDHLVASDNPLAITMSFRRDGQSLTLNRTALQRTIPTAGSKLLVVVHGLCMNDLQWQRKGHNHAEQLAADGWTPVYLHYNTGRHISENGRDFAALLDALVSEWPVPVSELMLLGHSMGGLVSRSACHVAEQEKLTWLAMLRTAIFLGSPHHGSPLEKGGNWIDAALGISPYTVAFSKLVKIRSAGITDLRQGNLHDADWQGRDRFDRHTPPPRALPLPAGVAVYLVAGTLAKNKDECTGTLIGDGLVLLSSALGKHKNPARSLAVPPMRRWIGYGMNHWDLLDRPEVLTQLRHWLSETPRRNAD